MPSLIFIVGPNGAGKTTFASEYLAAEDRRFEFVNADEIARELRQAPHSNSGNDRLSARLMLNRIDELVAADADFCIESTLASLIYVRKVPKWRRRGYVVSIVYLRLASVDEALARVRKRVQAGGHSIPEDIIRRRFDKSLAYFETKYKPIVDEWYIWESRDGTFVLVDMWTGHRP